MRKPRLFSETHEEEELTECQHAQKKQRRKSNVSQLVSFEFNDSFSNKTKNRSLFELLKQKIRKENPISLFSCDYQGILKAWQLNHNGKELVHIKTFDFHCTNKWHLSVNEKKENNKELVLVKDDGIFSLNVHTKKMACLKIDNSCSRVLWWKDDIYLILRDYESGVYIYDFRSNEHLIGTLSYASRVVNMILLSEKDHLLCGYSDGSLICWNLQTMEIIGNVEWLKYDVYSICEIEKGIVAILRGNYTDYVNYATIYNTNTKQKVDFLMGRCDSYTCCFLYSKTLKLLVSCGDNGKIKAWEIGITNGITIHMKFAMQNENGCYSMAFLKNTDKQDTKVIVGDSEGKFFIIDLESRKRISFEQCHENTIVGIAVC